MPPHPLTNFEKQKICVISPDEFKLIGTNWIALYVKGDNVTYFDSFRV